jgi:exodeoxyribonuclease VII large subunit
MFKSNLPPRKHQVSSADPMTSKPERKVFTVSEITGRIKALLELEFSSVWVEGEISNFTRAASGHLYFTIKDDTAQLRCVCFRTYARGIRFRPEDGLKVVARGSLSIYERRGEYQLYVEVMEPVGIGALQLAFEQLKAKLQGEGLFDTARKKPLPVYPHTVGVVTSPTGAAIQDILRILKRRNESINVLIYPAKVQGEGAAAEIVEGIRYFNREQNVDVLIVGRGGGSIEDLWAFNEEVVARAIAASKIPVISAVGHEIDFTIADFAADLRAPTPSAAAEIVSSAKEEISKHLARLYGQIENSLTLLLNRSRRRLLELTGSQGFSVAHGRLKEFRQLFDELAFKLSLGMQAMVRERANQLQLLHNRVVFFDLKRMIRMGELRLEQREKQVESGFRTRLATARNALMIFSGKLESLSPLKVLERGYAIVKTGGGVILNDAKGIQIGTPLFIQLWQGSLRARVTGSGNHPQVEAETQQGALKFEG